MAVTPLDGVLAGGMFGDAEIAAAFADAAELRAMLRVEAALAEAQGRLGMIPEDSARAIATAALGLEPDPADLASDTAGAGVPVPALVAALRAAAGIAHADYVHWGATSQDIVDTGLVLRLTTVLDVLDARLAGLVRALADQARQHRTTLIAARTRGRIAAPTTLGAKIAVWATPLLRHRVRLAEMRPRLLVVSLHGAAGTGAAFGGHGADLRRQVAAALGLAAAEVPWHAARDGFAELGGWLSMVSGSLGKLGLDLVLLGQSEIGEVSTGPGGRSSTLPQKSNPIEAEALVTLARANAGAVATMHQALVTAQERDGAAWGLEWLTLPGMCVATGAGLRIAARLASGLEAHGERIAATFAWDSGLMLAEAAVFDLARRMPRHEAETRVRAAVAAVHPSRDERPAELDRDPAACTGDAVRTVDAFLDAVRRMG